MARKNLLGRAADFLQETTGFSIVDTEHLRVTEAVSREAMILANDLEEIGYASMNFVSGRPSEPNAMARRRWAQQARVVWLADPQAGASVEMLNEFTFGRGVARPRAKDKEVQEVLDEAWDDPQNQRVLTSFVAQMKFGNSLSIQSNVFFTMFDDGEDGKVKLSFLNHDTVKDAQTDPENRQRALFYIASKQAQEWDYLTHAPVPQMVLPKVFYYENWSTVEEALHERGLDEEAVTKLLERYRNAARGIQDADPEDAGNPINPGQPYKVPGLPDDDPLTLPPPKLLGEGKVYHVAENMDMEMIFGVPRMRRTIRWYTAYNDFMAARVNMMQAAASFIATQTVTGSANSLEKMATKAMRSVSDLRSTVESAIDPQGVTPGPRPASIMSQTGNVKFEPLKLDSGSGGAQTDAQMLRAQVSAGDRFPQHYLGDIGSANLATATSMELPVLKHVEARQELCEGVFRWFLDRVVERAVEVGRLDPNQATTSADEDVPSLVRTGQTDEDEALAIGEGDTVVEHEMLWRINGRHESRLTRVICRENGEIEYRLLAPAVIEEAHEDKNDDEEDTGRDLSYEFGFPSPLRRQMTDLVAACVQAAQMADPNGINTELTRVLLTIVLAEGFEMQDAADVVDRIFPKGYNAIEELQKAQQAGMPPQQAGPPGQQGTNFFGPGATDLPANPNNAYGAPQTATAPEDVPGAQEGAFYYIEGGRLIEARAPQQTDWEVAPVLVIGRHGHPVLLPGTPRGGAREGTVPMHNGRINSVSRDFDRDLRGVTMDALASLDMDRMSESRNGSH